MLRALLPCAVAGLLGTSVGLGIAYVVLRSEVGRRPAARQLGYSLATMLATMLALVTVVVVLRGPTRRHVFEGSLLVLTLGLWVLIGWNLAGRLLGGPVLLSLPRSPRQWLAFAAVGLLLLSWGRQWGENDTALRALVHAEQASFVLCLAVAALSRPQVRTRGVVFGSLLPWGLLEGYAWEGEQGRTLTLHRRRTAWLVVLLFPKVSLRIPPQQHTAVDRLLRQYLRPLSPPVLSDTLAGSPLVSPRRTALGTTAFVLGVGIVVVSVLLLIGMTVSLFTGSGDGLLLYVTSALFVLQTSLSGMLLARYGAWARTHPPEVPSPVRITPPRRLLALLRSSHDRTSWQQLLVGAGVVLLIGGGIGVLACAVFLGTMGVSEWPANLLGIVFFLHTMLCGALLIQRGSPASSGAPPRTGLRLRWGHPARPHS